MRILFRVAIEKPEWYKNSNQSKNENTEANRGKNLGHPSHI